MKRFFGLFFWVTIAVAINVLAEGNEGVNYVYDNLNRLVRVINENGEVGTYNYDAVGNLLSIDKTTVDQLPNTAITSMTPNFVEQGISNRVTLIGNSLLGATLTTNRPDIVIDSVVSTDREVTANLTVPPQGALGAWTLTATGVKGSANVPFGVVERDLPISLALSPSPVSSNSFLALDIRLSNRSSAPWTNVRASMVVPTGLGFDDADNAEPNALPCPGGFNYCDAGEEAVWTFPTLAAGASVTIQVNATVAANLVNGTLLTVPLRVTADGAGAPVVVERTVVINNSPSLRGELSVNADPVTPGQTLSYTLDVGNRSTAAIAGVGHVLRLPLGVDFVSATGGGTYDASARAVSFDLGTLAAGGRAQRAVNVTVASTAGDGALLLARGEVNRSGSTDFDSVQSRSVVVDAQAALTGQIALSPDPVIAGQTLQTEFRISNNGSSALTNLKVVVPVPSGLGFDDADNAEPNALPCPGGFNYCDAGEEAVWTFPTLAAGASVTIQVNAAVAANLANGTLLTVPLRVTADGAGAPVVVERTVVINNSPSLRGELSVNADPVKPGQTLSYTIDVGNRSTAAIASVGYVLRLPLGVDFVSATGGGTYDASARAVSFDLGTLAAGGRAQRAVNVTVASTAGDGALLLARGEVNRSGSTDFDSVQSRSVVVDAQAALTGQIALSPDPVIAGQTLQTEFRISNNGSSALTNLKVVVPVPSGLGFDDADNAEPNALPCPGGFNYCDAGEEAVWTFPTLAAGASVTIQVNAAVAANLANGTLLTVPLRVTADGAGAPVVVERTVVINNSPSLRGELSVNADPVKPGQTLSYTIDVGNRSTAAIASVGYVLRLPLGVDFVSATGGGTYDASARAVSFDLGTLAAGGRAQRAVNVTVASTAGDGALLLARGEVNRSGSTDFDSVQSRSVVVDAQAALTGQIALSPDPVIAGQTLQTEFRISNNGSSALTNLKVVVPVPSGLGFDDADNAEPNALPCPGGFNYCDAGEEAVWTFPTLAAGASVTIQVNAAVAANLANGTLLTVPLRVTADGAGAPVVVERTVVINNSPSLRGELSVNADPVKPGQTLSYTIDVGNRSTAAIASVGYVLRLPLGVDFVSATGGGTYDASARAVSFDLGTLAAGGRAQRGVTVTVATTALDGALLLARGEVNRTGSSDFDSVQSRSVVVDTQAALTGQIALSPDPVVSGQTLQTEFRISNNGTSALTNLKVVVPVPSGLGFDDADNAEPNALPCPGGFNYCDAGEEAVWTFPTLAAGASVTIQVNAAVAANLANGTLLTVPLRVTADGAGAPVVVERTVVIGTP